MGSAGEKPLEQRSSRGKACVVPVEDGPGFSM